MVLPFRKACGSAFFSALKKLSSHSPGGSVSICARGSRPSNTSTSEDMALKILNDNKGGIPVDFSILSTTIGVVFMFFSLFGSQGDLGIQSNTQLRLLGM